MESINIFDIGNTNSESKSYMHYYNLNSRQEFKKGARQEGEEGLYIGLKFERNVKAYELSFIDLTYLLSKVGGYFSAIASLAIIMITPFLYWEFRKSLWPNHREY